MNFAGGALLEAGISCIVQKLGDFGVGRSQQFLEIVNDINSIKGELSMMKAISKDADRRMETSEAFKEWVKQVKNAAFMIEDFMDEYVYAEQGFEAEGSSSSDKVKSFNWQIVTKIEAIKNEVATISRRGQAYAPHLITQSFGLGCKQDEGESSRALLHRPVYSPPFEEVNIVGFDEDVSKLMQWLLSEEEMPWSIMSIVGMGGSGKTTLAKKIYSLVQNHFDHHFWVSVSQYSPSQLSDFVKDIEQGVDYSSKGRQRRHVRQNFTGYQDKWVDEQQQSQRVDFRKPMEEACYFGSERRLCESLKNVNLNAENVSHKGSQSSHVRQKFTGYRDEWLEKQQQIKRDFLKAMEEAWSSMEEDRSSMEEARSSGSIQRVSEILNNVNLFNAEYESHKQSHNLRSLRKLLDEKRYVLFLDDINDIIFWTALEGVLPGNGRGKIIFTSRKKITNSLANGSCRVHMLNPLPFELAWDLFCRNAFQNYTPPRSCPLYLNELGEAIVRRCSGLPLAIVLMGCLMSNKGNSPKKWKDVINHFDQELLHNPCLESLNWVLQTSYNNLPSQLKYCFLYCCLFPRHHKIKRKKMTYLWVAQRFVEKQQGKLLEDVADDYFIQLIESSFLQPIISEFTGEIIACNIHEIIHNFAISKFPEEFGILTKEPCNECEQKRFLALQNHSIPCERQHSKTRSFLFFARFLNFDYIMDGLLSQRYGLLSHRFLMVLCLDGMEIHALPNELCDLLHLRYLSLRGTRIGDLPVSLGKLYNLETLDARDTRIKSIPKTLVNLRKLRHLLLNTMKVYGTNRLVIMPTSMGNLNLLQTVLGVEADDNFTREVHHLVQLRKLYIRFTNPEHSDEPFLCTKEIQNKPEHPHKLLFASVQKIESLCSLKVESLDKEGKFTELRLETSFPLPAYLEKLALGGVIKELPPWFGLLRSLRALVLINSLLIADPLSDLAELPNLVSLKLIHAYTGEQMGCGPGGFPKLRHLHIASLVEFKEWTAIAEGAMPCIQFLSIIDCKKLRILPEGLERLKTVQSLEVIEMHEEFMASLMHEDNSKIQNIMKKTFSLKDRAGGIGDQDDTNDTNGDNSKSE